MLRQGKKKLKPKEEIAGFDISLAITAFTANVHYYFTEEGFRPYVGLDFGNYSASTKLGTASVSENYLGLAPTLGVLYGVTDNIDINVNVKYAYMLGKTVNDVEVDATTYLPISVGVMYKIATKK